MATITNLIPTIYEALDVVSRELVGMIPAVALSASSERAAKDQTITSFVAPAATASDVTPGVAPPDDGDQVIGNNQMTIDKVRRVPVRWNGEQSLSLNAPGGPGRMNIQRDQFAQGFRTLANEIEVDLKNLYIYASRAAGTAGTTPFAFSATRSGFEDVADARKILVDNGSPESGIQLVMGTTAGAKLRALAQLNNAQASGDTTFLRQGILLPIHGVDLRESGQITAPVTKGTGASATTDAAGYAIGATTLTLASAGTGTILAGDIITLAGDTNQYVVATGDADVSGGGTIVLAAPGLRQAVVGATAITVVNTSTRNMIFHRSAIVLATRVPARPEEGDLAEDVTTVTDPRSGITFEIAMYKQYRQVQYEISVAWGKKAQKTAHIGLLLG